jgi:hypothetical protein
MNLEIRYTATTTAAAAKASKLLGPNSQTSWGRLEMEPTRTKEVKRKQKMMEMETKKKKGHRKSKRPKC